MTTVEVIQVLPTIKTPTTCAIKLIKLFSNMILDLSRLFKGPEGYILGPDKADKKGFIYTHWKKLPTL